MSKIRMCDKCGKVLPKNEVVNFKTMGYCAGVPWVVHLCGGCCKEFADWLDYMGRVSKRKAEAERGAED